MKSFVAVAVALVACSSKGPATATEATAPPHPMNAQPEVPPAPDAGSPALVPPAKVVEPAAPIAAAQKKWTLDVEPDGIAWAGDRLVISDAKANRLAAWTEAGGVVTLAALPAPPVEGGKPGLGQPAQGKDGTWFVPRFGDGTAGAIFHVDAKGKVRLLPKLEPKRRRIGLAVTAGGELVETWFVKGKGAPPSGGYARVPAAGGKETDATTALVKPVGVAAIAAGIVVVDQGGDAVLLDGKPLATVHEPDLACATDDNAVLVTTKSGTVVEVTAAGTTKTLASDLGEPRGVAYDAKTRTIYVIVRGPAQGTPAQLVAFAR